MAELYKAWKRKLGLYILRNKPTTTGELGEPKATLDLSGLRVTFRITQQLTDKPETAEITIYNLSDGTGSKIKAGLNAGDSIVLTAGYEGHDAPIFSGEIVWKNQGRTSETDTFLQLVAISDFQALRYSVAIGSIPAGSTDQDEIGFLTKALNQDGCSVKACPELSKKERPRGKVFFTKSWEAAQAFCRNHNLVFGGTQDGLVFVDSEGGVTQDTRIVLNNKTGLIGLPELTPGGVAVRCLLNPRLKLGRKVEINNSAVQYSGGFDTSYSYNVEQNDVLAQRKLLGANGIYTVVARDFVGDTHGNEWYCDLILQTTDENAITSLQVSNSVSNPNEP